MTIINLSLTSRRIGDHVPSLSNCVKFSLIPLTNPRKSHFLIPTLHEFKKRHINSNIHELGMRKKLIQ